MQLRANKRFNGSPISLSEYRPEVTQSGKPGYLAAAKIRADTASKAQ
jgi:hypothetical protein